jgi:hypothetical protein
MIVGFNNYFDALCALCEQLAKREPEAKRILSEAERLAPVEKVILTKAIQVLERSGASEDRDTTQDLPSGELGPQLKIFFTELFLQAGGRPAKADWTIDSDPSLSWSGTHYCADEAEKCLYDIIQQCKMATDRIQRLSGNP